jgi:hypothetical protein
MLTDRLDDGNKCDSYSRGTHAVYTPAMADYVRVLDTESKRDKPRKLVSTTLCIHHSFILRLIIQRYITLAKGTR